MRSCRFAAALLCLAACRGNPVSPALTIPSVGGQWIGTFESSNYQPLPISMTLNQTLDNITGTWAEQTGTGSGGNVGGNATTMGIAGTITLTSSQPTSCTTPFSASVFGSPSTMTLTLGTFTGNCNLPGGNPVAPRFVLQRR
jgi:hypothetical protein